MVKAVFLSLAALLAIIAGGAMLWPLLRAGKRAIWGTLVGSIAVATVGLYLWLGTPAALRLYREYLAARGMGAVLLDPEHQQQFMDLVYRIKSGDLGEEVQAGMAQLVDRLQATGAEALIAGCTEVPLVYDGFGGRLMFVDPGAETARRCVDVCLGHAPAPPVHTSAF